MSIMVFIMFNWYIHALAPINRQQTYQRTNRLLSARFTLYARCCKRLHIGRINFYYFLLVTYSKVFNGFICARIYLLISIILSISSPALSISSCRSLMKSAIRLISAPAQSIGMNSWTNPMWIVRAGAGKIFYTIVCIFSKVIVCIRYRFPILWVNVFWKTIWLWVLHAACLLKITKTNLGKSFQIRAVSVKPISSYKVYVTAP